MEKSDIKCIMAYRLEESRLEEKYRAAKDYTYMILNGRELRWPRQKDLIAAINDHTAEFFIPGGFWESLTPA